MKVLVTGGAGFIGGHLVERLVGRGDTVTVLDDLSTGSLDNLAAVRDHVTVVTGSVTDPTTVAQVAAGQDLVFHLAAYTASVASRDEPLAVHDINVTGTLNVLTAATDAAAIVIVSSAAVYGDQETNGPIVETAALQPATPYALSKLMAEQYGMLMADDRRAVTCLRLFNVYGPRQALTNSYAAVIASFLGALTANREPVIYGSGAQTRDFVYVDDVVTALLLASQSSESFGVYNIGTGIAVTVNDLLREIGAAIDIVPKPRHEAARPGDIDFSQADITRAKTKLRFTPSVPLTKGLRATAQWYREAAQLV